MAKFFEIENERLKPTQQSKRVEPVRFRGRNPKITLLVDLPFSTLKCSKVLDLICQNTSAVPDDFEIIYCYVIDFPLEDKTKPTDRAWNYSVDLDKLLTRGRNVVAWGRAFYSITMDTDILVDGFFDTVFNEPFLKYQPKACNVYPVSGFYDLFRAPNAKAREMGDAGLRAVDNFEMYFMLEQTKRALSERFVMERERPIVHHLLSGPNEVNQFFRDNIGPGEMAWDLETSGFDFQRDEVIDLTWTVSLDNDTRPGRPVGGVDGYHAFWRDVDPEAFSGFLEGKRQYLSNGKFDIRFMRHRGVKNTHIDMDTWICGHLLNELRSNSLKTHAWNYTTMGGYDLPLEKWKREHPKIKSYANIPDAIRVPYSIDDPIATFRVAKKMYEELLFDKEVQQDMGHLGRDNLLDYHEDHVVPALNMFVDLELQGVCIDWEQVEKVSQLLNQKIAESLEDVYRAFGTRKISISSGPELGKFLEAFGYPELPKGKTKAGFFKTNKEMLQEWEKRGMVGAKEIMVHAKWQALQNTFVGEDVETKQQTMRDSKADGSFMRFEDGDEEKFMNRRAEGLWKYRGTDDRIHAQFLAFLALSHRHRTKDPNLQNAPKRDKESAMILRSVYTTPVPGEFYIVEPDYAGFQLRIAAAQSGDENMRRAFKEVPGGDLHSVTAQAVFRPSAMEVHLEDGSMKLLSIQEKVKVTRENKQVEVQGNELEVDDYFDSSRIMKTLCRKINLDEFIHLKKKIPYKHQRDKSKNTNFGFEFGSSARAFMENVLFSEWTMQEAEDYALDNDLYERVKEIEFNPVLKKREDHRVSVYLACAEDIRKIFFELYPLLVPWHKECIAEAKKFGFVRSPFGARRLFPMLTYSGVDSDGGEVKNQENQTINTRVQNHEVIPMTKVMCQVHALVKEKNLKSRVVLTVHDSIKLYIHRSEIQFMGKKILEFMAYDWPQHKGIPVFGEMNIAKPWEGEVWGFGSKEFELSNVDKICEILGETTPQVAA